MTISLNASVNPAVRQRSSTDLGEALVAYHNENFFRRLHEATDDNLVAWREAAVQDGFMPQTVAAIDGEIASRVSMPLGAEEV